MLYGRIVRVWVLIFPFFAITNPEDLQTVLSSKKHTEKIFFYKLLHNFLGNGLITSSGKKLKVHFLYYKFYYVDQRKIDQISLKTSITNMFSMIYKINDLNSPIMCTMKRERDVLRIPTNMITFFFTSILIN